MKRIVLLFLALAVSLSLFGCRKYEPQASTALESTPVATLRYGKKTYKVNYELFRMFLLSAKEVVSGGDLSKFEGDGAEALYEQARTVALDKIYETYSVFALCDTLDINLYSADVNKKVEESIRISVEGGTSESGETVDGIGSYEKYLESLKLFYANYAVQDLLLRYEYGISAINAYYRGTYDDYGILAEEGALSYTDADVTAYYNSDETRRILFAFTMVESIANSVRDQIELFALEEEVIAKLMSSTIANDYDGRYGMLIGENTLNSLNYSDVTEAAFALEIGEAAVVAGRYNKHDGYFVLYRAQKSEENLEENRERIESYYVENEIGERYAAAKKALIESAVFSDFYKGLKLSAIAMDEEEK